mmetsp:Transcript_14897/g.29676  ORF Transcript_14897/g.29676 Transcript_14897/m.29676 type:complete len:160 (-) Transcript_14897:12-491(-)
MDEAKALIKAAPSILDSYVRGDSFKEALNTFYKLHSPKFSEFVEGDEYRLDQSEAHGQYLDELEALLEGKLEEFTITSDHFAEVLSTMLEGNDDVSKQLMEAMDLSFEDFGSMMRSKFDELYGVTRKEADVGLGLNAHSKRNPALSLRILWDIENVPVP